jgi:hypothetical protein
MGHPGPSDWLWTLLRPSEVVGAQHISFRKQYDRMWELRTIVIDMGRCISWLLQKALSLNITLPHRYL